MAVCSSVQVHCALPAACMEAGGTVLLQEVHRCSVAGIYCCFL